MLLSLRTRVGLAFALVALIALIDWRVDAQITFGFLYLFPVLLVGTVWPRWQILATALVCTLLADLFDPFAFTLGVALPQDILVFTSLAGTGLFAFEVTRSRRREMETLHRVEREVAARREAEEQLEFLIDSSPVAILTMAADSLISRANLAAHRLFDVEPNSLPGRNIRRYVPALARVPLLGETPQTFRTEMQCRGEREHGDVFLANVFFSTYQTAMGPRLAALVVDASEELREREEASLEQLMAGSRILVGAVSHEVRNVCSAIGIIHENLVRGGTLTGNKDFEALGSLVETLNRIASLELKQSASQSQVDGIDLSETLGDLRIVLEPMCQEAEIEVHWFVPEDLPPVWADRHTLLQALLNLTKNSRRALAGAPVKKIDVTVAANGPRVSIRVTDSGPGIRSTVKLFQPFQKGAEATGLGLFLSRAFVRSFHGDLRHDPTLPGCSFVIELAIAGPADSPFVQAGVHDTHPTLIA
ncbi:MAG TPA: ATP-binding protein [Candidatus Sulfopaludibacter sp.]|jgi:signal transduction histidine kinase|nr:ATP-binding protein [Candidatus Sulfopaludibacter sp.]